LHPGVCYKFFIKVGSLVVQKFATIFFIKVGSLVVKKFAIVFFIKVGSLVQKFATIFFYQGWFPCCAIASHTLYRLRGSMQQQDYSSSNRHMQVSVTYNNIFDGKPSMS
jgi:hypothetical protein